MSVITEILRVTLLSTTTIPHKTKEDVVVCGQSIPKGNLEYLSTVK